MNQSNYNYQGYPYSHIHHHQASSHAQQIHSPPFQSHSYPPQQWEQQWDDYSQIIAFNRQQQQQPSQGQQQPHQNQQQQHNFMNNVNYHQVQFSATSTHPVIYQSFATLSSSPPLPQMTSVPVPFSQSTNAPFPNALQLASISQPTQTSVGKQQPKSPELPEWAPLPHSPSPPLQQALNSPKTPPECLQVPLTTLRGNLLKMVKLEKRTSSSNSLQSPKSITSQNQTSRPFSCDYPNCSRSFKRAEHLKRHVRSLHTKEKPYLCPEPTCKKAFSRSDNLNQHTKVHKNLHYIVSKGQTLMLKSSLATGDNNREIQSLIQKVLIDD